MYYAVDNHEDACEDRQILYEDADEISERIANIYFSRITAFVYYAKNEVR